MPEGRIPLAQAVTYLATAPKSNASYVAINEALRMVREEGHRPVPPHLRDANYKGAAALGHGQGYLYPHDYPGHFVPQRYLPRAWTSCFTARPRTATNGRSASGFRAGAPASGRAYRGRLRSKG